MKSVRYLLLLPVAALVLAGCQQQPTVTSSEDTVMKEDDAMTEKDDSMMEENDAMMKDENVDFTLETSNFKFSQDEMRVKAGETVRVKLVDKEGFHDFVIDELDVASSRLSEPGQEEIIEFTVPEDMAGQTIEYYCSVGNHRQMGMFGQLIIE